MGVFVENSFSPDLSKQTQEIVFSFKNHNASHPKVNFNNLSVVQSTYLKNLGLYFDQKINFSHHVKVKISKAYRGIGVIKKVQNNLPGQSLLAICKSQDPILTMAMQSMTNYTMRLSVESLKVFSVMQLQQTLGAIRGTSKAKLLC